SVDQRGGPALCGRVHMEADGRTQADARHNGETILVVEYEWLLRATVADYLRDCDFHVAEAASADEAVDLLADGLSVDLVISDVRMPGSLDGIDLADWAAKHRPELPVILASGVTGPGREAEAMRHARYWLSKPFNFGELYRAVTALLRTGSSRVA
ncbi:MAG: response regulator, partial [Rhodanobacter sp.]